MKMSFVDFILRHEEDDPVRLLLSRDKLREQYPDIDVDLAVTTLEVRRKLKHKVPEWYAVPSLIYPFRLSGEQCSSSETARYKSEVVRCHSERSEGIWRVADLTGGMGVDAWAFSQVAEEVLYNEMQVELARAAELNFRDLGVANVVFRNCRVEPGKVAEVLDGFHPDVIFLDPARRAEDGRKVFLIEECQPDVLGLLPELFGAGRYVLLKLSPMADITMACKRLGAHVKEVHVVASGGECKELLFLLDRDWTGTPATYVVEGGAVMEIPGQAGNEGSSLVIPSEAKESVIPTGAKRGPLVISTGAKRSGEICLFEPGKALLKAGAFNLPCSRFGLAKLGIHTHLYAGESVPEELRPFGKVFDILEVLPLNNRSMKEAGRRWPQAEVTARNVPMSSELLRKKIGCASGGDIHLFGVRVDAADGAGNYLIVTRKQYGAD